MPRKMRPGRPADRLAARGDFLGSIVAMLAVDRREGQNLSEDEPPAASPPIRSQADLPHLGRTEDFRM